MYGSRIISLIVLSAAFFHPATGQSPRSSQKPSIDTVLVYGDGFTFSMKEPEGWQCLCDESVGKYGVNAMVLPSSPESRAHHVEIKVRVNGKADENTALDLAADMEQYKKKYPNVQFAALDVAHPEYETYPKLFSFPNDFYDYVAYLNPGPRASFTLSVSMSKEKEPATKEELAAYQKVLQSLHVFTEASR